MAIKKIDFAILVTRLVAPQALSNFSSISHVCEHKIDLIERLESSQNTLCIRPVSDLYPTCILPISYVYPPSLL